MNDIKYVNASGEKKTVRVSQPSYSQLMGVQSSKKRSTLPTMAEADEQMHKKGFRRAGLRWKRAA